MTWDACASRYTTAEEMMSAYVARARAAVPTPRASIAIPEVVHSPPAPPVDKPRSAKARKSRAAYYEGEIEDIPAVFRGFRLRRAARLICQRTKARTELLMTMSRRHEVVAARKAMAFLLLRKGWSYCEVGRALQRDHTTILYYVRPKRR
jgi:hypothetical protein